MAEKRVAYFIDAEKRTIKQIEFDDWKDIDRLIGGQGFCIGYNWPNGDVLYVDDNGLLNDPQHGFRIPERPDQALAGNGFMVGREKGYDPKTGEEDDYTFPPTMTLPELRLRVMFVDFNDAAGDDPLAETQQAPVPTIIVYPVRGPNE